jgi:cell wall-associated NlpC family hydrolase
VNLRGLLLAGVLLLPACGWMGSTEEEPPPVPRPAAPKGVVSLADPVAVRQALYARHSHWKGVPYRLGGDDPGGLDCSAFTQLTYRDLFGITIPRDTNAQRAAGRVLPPTQALPGDLLFFNTGRTDRHVGIYMGGKQFLHVSTRAGVMISSLSEAYWAQRFVSVVRIGRP